MHYFLPVFLSSPPAQTLDGGFPELRQTVWQSAATVQAAVQALTPQMAENKSRVEDLLREALLLQVGKGWGVGGPLVRLQPFNALVEVEPLPPHSTLSLLTPSPHHTPSPRP